MDKIEQILGLISEMQNDFKEVRTEMQNGFKEVRTEMQNEFKEVRTEMQNGFKEIRTEMQNEFKEVRSEMQDGFDKVYSTMQEEFNSVYAEFKDIQMTLENETNKNIQLIAEGHFNLGRKLDDALKIENEKELMLIRLTRLENEIRRLKIRIEETA